MSTLVNTETGELVEFDRSAAERRAERITLRLDTIADNYRAVLPMIREAIEKRDDLALGYRSPGDYVSDRFGQSLAGLGIEVRRAVVGELTEAGLSTRAIAPVVGVTDRQVRYDVQQVGSLSHPQSPESSAAPSGTERQTGPDDSGQTPEGEESPSLGSPTSPRDGETAPRPPVTGIDGKQYTRPEPKTPPRRALTDVARDLGQDLRRITDRFERFAGDDRLSRNKNEVAAHLRHHLAHALQVLADLEQEINSQEESTQ